MTLDPKQRAAVELAKLMSEWEYAAWAWTGQHGTEHDERAELASKRAHDRLKRDARWVSIWRSRHPRDPRPYDKTEWTLIVMGKREDLDAAIAIAHEELETGKDRRLTDDFVRALRARRLDQAIANGSLPQAKHFVHGAEMDRMGRIHVREAGEGKGFR